MASATAIDDRVRDFTGRTHRLLIGGEWVEPSDGRTFATLNPATEEQLSDVALAGERDVDRAVIAARRAFDDDGGWRTMSPAERSRIVWRIGDLIEEHAEELALLESLDNGKPVELARTIDMGFAGDLFRYMAGWCTKLEGETVTLSAYPRPGESHAYTLREPVGVVAQIIPWNFPLLMASWKVAPALACGCTVILKPAEQTPLTALRMAELIQEAGVPDGVFNVLTGEGATGAALAQHRLVDKIAFTGSTEVGKSIVTAAAGNLKRVTLELGGKSASVVYDDANLETAIPGAANAVFANIGECCTAASRLYVQRGVYDEVLAGISEIAGSIKIGVGTDPQSEMGPLISAEQLERVSGFIEAGRRDGAELVTGGARIGDTGYFIEPTVFKNTSPEMSIEREEIFGPVVSAIPFDSFEEVVERAKARRHIIQSRREAGKIRRRDAAIRISPKRCDFSAIALACPFC
mgnify:CR=1 FL=1